MNRKDLLTCAVFAAVLILFASAFVKLGSVQEDSENEMVYTAVKNAALTCYAVEGAYPQELEYLSAHYGLLYDADRFIVVYDAFASNILPDIVVLERGNR